MKIRTNFVSNSSSSSFIIQGKRIYTEDVNSFNFSDVYVLGDWIDNGEDMFRLQDVFANIEEFKAYESVLSNKRMIISKAVQCEDEMGVPVCKDAESVFVVNKDYDATENFNQFLDRYKEIIIRQARKDKNHED